MTRFTEQHYFQCECQTEEHTIIFAYTPEDGDLCISVQLHQFNNWFKRAWIGIKYIFGYKCKHGHWDCTLLDSIEVTRLKELCERTLADRAQNPDRGWYK